MSLQVGRIGLLVLAVSACSGVADPMGLPVEAAGDLKTGSDAALQGADAPLDAAMSPDGARGEASASSTGALADAAISADAGPGDTGTDAAEPPDATLPAAAAGDAGSSAEAAVAGDSTTAATVPQSCFVAFTVADAFIDGVIDTGVAMGGDTSALGDWQPDAAVPMTSIGAGAWTLSLLMNDGDAIQFLFVKRGPASNMWEDWDVNSNRSLVVSCTPSADAAAPIDGGPVVGTSYAGEFGVRPPDAT